MMLERIYKSVAITEKVVVTCKVESSRQKIDIRHEYKVNDFTILLFTKVKIIFSEWLQ